MNVMCRLVTLTCLLMLSSLSVWAVTAEEITIYRAAAEKGEAWAQYNLGVLYANGKGVSEDDTEALRWWSLAAEQGYAIAQFNLGVRSAHGIGEPEDDTKALNWYTQAAEQDYAPAQYNLGWMYANGKGVPEDNVMAVKWYTQAAEQGLPRAQYNLGLMYASGKGVPEDDVMAYMWWSLAAALGEENAKEKQEIAEKHMTLSNISIAKSLSRECLEREYKRCANQFVKHDAADFFSKCYSLTGNKINMSDQHERFVPIYVPSPRYPAKAEKYGLTGYVILEFDIVKSGNVESVRVVESCPTGLFDKTSLEAGAGLRYSIEVNDKKLSRITGVMYKFSFAGFIDSQ